MHILKFMAQRTKNLTVVEIDPDGNDVILSGKNGQGKSNILNIIMSVLTGDRLVDPIKHGEERAEVLIDCGAFKVKKKWTAKGEYIQVVMSNGDIKSKPMEFLGGIVGKISFDPTEFGQMKPKDQRETLRQLVGLDFTDIETEYKKVFDERSVVNSSIKGVIAQLGEATAPDPKTPDEEILFKEELEKLNQLRDKRTHHLEVKSQKEDLTDDIVGYDEDVQGYQDEIKRLQELIKEKTVLIQRLVTDRDAIVLPPEVTESEIIAVESSLNDVESKNVTIRAAKRYRQLIRESNTLQGKADGFKEKLNRLEQDKQTRIANAKFPIEGLGIDDEEIIYKGKKITILSDGEKARVFTAISMALNPTLKVIFIRHANDLDPDGKKEIIDLAKEKGYQVWMEVVDVSGELGYFIEDGSVTKIDGKPVEQPVIAES